MHYRSGILALAAGLMLAAITAQGQFISSAPQSHISAKTVAVRYQYPGQVTLPAGKASVVKLHFRVTEGLHINSHTPSEDYLIPTTLSLPASSGVKLAGVVYPPGKYITLPIDPKTKLSVYTGEFILQTRLIASAGNHLMRASLHYQACDQTQCLPPKTIQVAVDVIGR